MKGFGKRLKKLREQNGLTQTQLAKILNCTDGAIRGWESERREMDHDTIKQLSDYFNVSADYLLGLSDQREKKLFPSEKSLQELNSLVENMPNDDQLALVKKIKNLSPENIQLIKNLIDNLKD